MCDTLVALAAVTGGPTLFGKNSDRPPDERQILEFHPAELNKTVRNCTYIGVHEHSGPSFAVLGSRPTWGWGFEHGVNEQGVAIGNQRITTIHDPRPYPKALTGMDLVRLTLERAPSAAAGVAILTELLERYGQGGSGLDTVSHSPTTYWSSFLLADSSDAWVIDTTARVWAAEQIVGSRAVSNRPAIASFNAAYGHHKAPLEERVDPRLRVTRAVLRNPVLNRSLVTRQHLCDALRSHEGNQGWSTCMHVDGVQQTTASMVAELFPNRMPRVWVAEGSPCETIHREVAFGPSNLRV